MTTLLEFFGSSTAQPVDSGDTGISGDSGSLFKAQFLVLKVLVVETVAHEINQIRNDSLGTFLFQKLCQMIVGSRKEFYQDLSYDTDFRFL